MNEQFNKFFTILMYATSALFLLVLLIPAFFIHLSAIELYMPNEFSLESGTANISELDLSDSRPFDLQGEWISYEGVYIDTNAVDYSLLTNPTYTDLPTRNLEDSKGTVTYKLDIIMNVEPTELYSLVLSISHVTESVRVFINGHYVPPFYAMQSWTEYDSESSMYTFRDYYNGTKDSQEIIISINKDETDSDLFNRPVTISTIENILALEKISFILEGLFLGMMLITIIIGITFILIAPTFSPLTMMNLFDTALMLHIFFNISRLPYIIMDTLVYGSISDELFRRLDLGFLFLAGFLGNTLARILFDPKNKAPKIFNIPINVCYITLCFIGLFYPAFFNSFGISITIVVLFLTFLGLIVKFMISLYHKKISVYKCFHVVKSIFVGVIIYIDTSTLNNTHRPITIILVGYLIFFFFHLLIRALEYRIPYSDIKKLNSNLERTIAERTLELTKTNEVLKNLSIIDNLTKAYNRLYFEEELSTTLEKLKNITDPLCSLHMCIFDLDDFKKINDTFGHSVGDDQLIEAVQLVQSLVSNDIIVSRIGGEEFTLLFCNYSDNQVLMIAEKLRSALEKMAHANNRTTGSFGIMKATNSLARKDIFVHADNCLYYSKTHGKNQISYDFGDGIKSYQK